MWLNKVFLTFSVLDKKDINGLKIYLIYVASLVTLSFMTGVMRIP